MAGGGCDNALIREELRLARIPAIELPSPQQGEVRATVQGELHGWRFERAWYYWCAENREYPLPFEIADELHEFIGQEVRVAGHCECPSPRSFFASATDPFTGKEYRGVPSYHINSQLGLYLLAEAIVKARVVVCSECGKKCPEGQGIGRSQGAHGDPSQARAVVIEPLCMTCMAKRFSATQHTRSEP